jgi:solute carrier family 25 S-adenosylmethionine transporter 26
MFFPLDTIKTRVQSSAGFWAAGGFKGVYRGVGSVGLGGAPGGEWSGARAGRGRGREEA